MPTTPRRTSATPSGTASSGAGWCTAPGPRGGRLGLVLAGLLAIVLPLAACGGSGSEVRSAGAPAATQAPVDDLPVLPPVEERQPEQFDDRGCLVIGPGRSDCSTTGAEVDAGAAGSAEGDERALLGFLGTGWVEGATGGPVVLEDTVTSGAAADGKWRAVGLARNEGPTTASRLEVRARIVAADGTDLGVVTGEAAVGGVRSGEPVPFVLTSEVPADQVASIVWEAVAIDGPAASRSMEITLYWTRVAGGDPVDHYLHRDGADRPQLLFAGVVDRGDAAVAAPQVVVAWVGPDGAVRGVATAPVAGPDASPLAALGPGAAADALVVLDDPVRAEGLADAVPVVWAEGK